MVSVAHSSGRPSWAPTVTFSISTGSWGVVVRVRRIVALHPASVIVDHLEACSLIVPSPCTPAEAESS